MFRSKALISKSTFFCSLLTLTHVNAFFMTKALTSHKSQCFSSMTDASHANDPLTMRSISGTFVLLGRNILDWNCRHQPFVTLHSGEAETVAVSIGATFLMYWIQLIEFMTTSRPVAELLTDSTTARNFQSTPLHTSKMRHIRIKLFFVRELVQANWFRLLHVAGTDNPADLFTKHLAGRDRVLHLCELFGLASKSVTRSVA